MSEDEPTPEEMEEARALAEALDGGAVPSRGASAKVGEPPRDALEAAALLRYSQDDGLDPARTTDIGREFANASETANAPDRADEATSFDLRLWTVVVPAAAMVAAAAAIAILWRAPGGELPPPHLALLRAQTEVIVAPGEGLAELQEQNARYRERWLVSMRDRYEGQR